MEFIVPLKGMKHMNMGLILDDYKTFQQATGTMILLVYVGSTVIQSASRIK